MDQLLNAYSGSTTGVKTPSTASSPFDSTGMDQIWMGGGGGSGMGESGDGTPGYQSGWQQTNPDGSKTNYDMTGYNQGTFSGDGLGGGLFGGVMKVLPAATMLSLAAIGGTGAMGAGAGGAGAVGGAGAEVGGSGLTAEGFGAGAAGGSGGSLGLSGGAATGADLGASFSPALDSQAAYTGGTQVVPGALDASAGAGAGNAAGTGLQNMSAGGPGSTLPGSGVSMPTTTGNPGFMDSLSQMYNNPSWSNAGSLWDSTGIGFNKGTAQGLSSLYDMYAKNKLGNAQMDLFNSNKNAINNYYAPGSPEAKLMEQTMNRQDAAAGRNSQYGVRATDLQAKIAAAKMQALSSMATGQSSLLTSGIGNQTGMFNSLAGYLGQNQSTASMPGFGGSTQNNGQIPSWLQALMNGQGGK